MLPFRNRDRRKSDDRGRLSELLERAVCGCDAATVNLGVISIHGFKASRRRFLREAN